MAKLHNQSLTNIYLQYVALFVHVAQLLCAIKKEQFLGGGAQLEEKMIVLNKTKILHLQQGLRHHQDFSLNFYKFHFHQVRCLFKNNGILLPKLFLLTVRKNVLVTKKKLLKFEAELFRTIYSNSERSEQFW